MTDLAAEANTNEGGNMKRIDYEYDLASAWMRSFGAEERPANPDAPLPLEPGNLDDVLSQACLQQ
jgi:hypothetical protein